MTMYLGEATIGAGSAGDEVKRIQSILQGQGYNVGPVDGLYGPQTQAAVVAFQKAKGLMPDGMVGPLTWAALQGTPPAPAPLPPATPAPAPRSSMLDMLNPTVLMVGIGIVALMSMMGKKR